MKIKYKIFSCFVIVKFLFCDGLYAVNQKIYVVQNNATMRQVVSTTPSHKIPMSPRSKDTSFDTIPYDPSRINMISFCGGGIRGIVAAKIAEELERNMRVPMYQKFHIMGGTSTGAIIAAALSADKNVFNHTNLGVTHKMAPRNLYTASDVVDMYEKHAKKIFQTSILRKITYPYHGAWYDSAGRQSVFEKFFGDLTLKDSLSDLVIPYFNLDTCSPNLLRTRYAKSDEHKNFLIKDVLMASSAAPTYFKPHDLQSVEQIENGSSEMIHCADGGIGINDPAFFMLEEGLRMYPNASSYFLLSIGNGECKRPSISRKTLWSWMCGFSDAALYSTHDVSQCMLTTVNSSFKKPVYYRELNVPLEEDCFRMDNISEENINNLKNAVQGNSALLEGICEIYNKFLRGPNR